MINTYTFTTVNSIQIDMNDLAIDFIEATCNHLDYLDTHINIENLPEDFCIKITKDCAKYILEKF